ncbi:hypothetical protein PCAR4_350023 [Paraburkholderia caribensis]|nr:hypothetical protein PCAR4_350023 [Paraburkholderia caribensis]
MLMDWRAHAGRHRHAHRATVGRAGPIFFPAPAQFLRNAAVHSHLEPAQQKRRDPTRLRRNEEEVQPARA